MGFKYIMLEVEMGEHTSKMIPIIFPDFMIHQDLVKSVQKILKQTHKMESKVFSAGDIQFEDPICEGGGKTLKIDSDDDDEKIINTYDYLHGMCFRG